MKKIFAAFLAAAMLFLISCSTENGQSEGSSDAEQVNSNQSSSDVGNFQTVDIEGQSFDSSIFEDHDLTLVNIWATRCPPCIAEIPDLGELARDIEGEGVNIIGIVLDVLDDINKLEIDEQVLDKAIEIMESSNAEYTVLIPDRVLLSTILKSISAFPTTVFIDKNGNLVGNPVVGAKSKAQWSTLIYQYQELLSS